MKIRIENLRTIEPKTQHQSETFQAWKKDDHNIVLDGTAGTGKTFVSLYLALETVLDPSTDQETIHIFRSVVPTRDIGFLPGTLEEKLEPYLAPYKGICSELFVDAAGRPIKDAFDIFMKQGVIEVHSTSFVRGTTFDSSVMLIDEMQNMTGEELDTVITRAGIHTRMIYCGDYHQSDLKDNRGKKDILSFLKILSSMCYFSTVNYDVTDIVRSDLVRDYILTKESLRETNR